MAAPRLLFYFLHLLGVGHVHRAKRLIEGFADQGIAVDVIYGGHDIGERFAAESIHYLPPIAAKDASYASYVDADGEPLGEAFMEARKASLLNHLETLKPDSVLIEAWPFGRRIVRHEIIAMMEALAKRPTQPLRVTSVRDILQPRKKGRAEETCETITRHIDHVLVHSDPSVIPLDATFPLAKRIADKLCYTGFVVPSINMDANVRPFDVIVTCGGGGFGFEMLETAMHSSVSGPLASASWCLATGPHMNESDVAKLRNAAPANVTVVERLENLSAHMAKAKLSISQCGYNTAMDALAAGQISDCHAIFIPYDTTGQSEQIKRAELLAKRGLAQCLPQSALTKEALEAAIQNSLNSPKIDAQIDFKGVETSARLMRTWLEERA
ncbi:glycosyltransferase family protein [Pseudahrensia aquimaris]|uniref:Glycosyltransferase family protein n=1 Tax=Pseudahrensia aquimaris TaxID=744461 RepID=A0ABW3FEY5_9HYPH